MYIQNNSKIVFIGDSITDCGRGKPVGEAFAGLGNGYVNIVNSMLHAFVPGNGIRVVNMGISGNTVRNLKARWQEDLLDLNPNYVSILIGVNDVWRRYDHPFIGADVGLSEYRETYKDLIEKTLPKVKGIILMTPFILDLNTNDKMRQGVDELSEVVREFAKEYNLLLVDLQKEFDEVLKKVYQMFLSNDRVHPNTIGHTIIAKAFLKAVGMDFNL